MQALKKAQEIHKQNADIRRQKRAIEIEKYNKKIEELEEEYVKNLEEKILKKALAIKNSINNMIHKNNKSLNLYNTIYYI